MDRKPASECVFCHKCRDNCAFLSKYGIDIGDTDRLKELAYSCFLCGRCTEVCPLNIDGRQTVIDLRRERAESEEHVAIEKAYKGLISEKKNYKFRNWKHVTSETVFFPGCNFPSLFPRTNSLLVKIFEEHGIGTVYECCGKPIAELGFRDEEERIISNIRKRLEENNITEIVTACPNCLDFFGDRLGVTVRSVYSKLAEMGIGSRIEGDALVYIPCPDREEKKWIEDLKPFFSVEISPLENVQCCGLGGSAGGKEQEIVKGFVKDIGDKGGQHFYTYCASCVGQFGRNGLKNSDHILTKILGTDERPDTKKSYVNRVITKFK